MLGLDKVDVCDEVTLTTYGAILYEYQVYITMSSFIIVELFLCVVNASDESLIFSSSFCSGFLDPSFEFRIRVVFDEVNAPQRNV
jgi:hypothetical protein